MAWIGVIGRPLRYGKSHSHSKAPELIQHPTINRPEDDCSHTGSGSLLENEGDMVEHGCSRMMVLRGGRFSFLLLQLLEEKQKLKK